MSLGPSAVAAIFYHTGGTGGLYKDESTRLGLGSFKALGGAYAAERALCERVERGAHVQSLTLVCATDGNHGRSVAYAARKHGASAKIFVHDRAPDGKVAAIDALGATIIRTPGGYDASVRAARAFASRSTNYVLVPDTTDDTSDLTPTWVMQGYGVMALELFHQLREAPTHVFLQAGVGGFAAGIAGLFAERFNEARPTCIVVEPFTAACLFESMLRGHAASVPGPHVTAMAMLSCGKASPLAWRILRSRADAFMKLSDEDALEWVQRLRSQARIDVGVSGIER